MQAGMLPAPWLAQPNRKRNRGEPSAKTLQRNATQAAAHARKAARLFSVASCTRPGYNDMYTPDVILTLRFCFARLSTVDQRRFLSPGVRCDLNKSRVNTGGNLSNVKLHVNYRLEKPAGLMAALAIAACNNTILPEPAVDACAGCSQQFLHWAVGRSVTFSNQPSRKVPSRSGPMGPSERVHSICPEPAVGSGEGRLAVMTTVVTEWLAGQRTEHLVLPNEDATVLPYKDRHEAHAMFVLDAERMLNVPYAEQSRDACFSNNLGHDDGVEEALGNLPPDDAERANRIVQAKPRKSRYGNVACGARGDVPEHKSIASFTWFCTVWRTAEDKKYKKTCKIRKWIPFAKCTECSTYRETKNATHCPQKRATILADQQRHLERVKRERVSYYVRRQLSISYPHRYLSVIIDGAESSSYALPHIAHRSHAADTADKVKMHVLGAIVHGRNTYAFTCPPHIAQGHNITIQCVHDVLMRVLEEEGCIPPILNVQLDNTSKQNKGQHLVAYLGYLVQTGVVREAYMNFLPVGHTHEDIDQVFSRISVYTRHNNATCPEGLCECIRRSFKKFGKAPIVVPWETVANISEYLKGYTCSYMSKDISLYYQLRISMGKSDGVAGVPILSARSWPGTPANDPKDYWRGLLPDTAYTRIFESKPDLLNERELVPPQMQPHHIGSEVEAPKRKTYAQYLGRVLASTEKLISLYPANFSDAAQAGMRRLIELLGSNLNPLISLDSMWPQTDLDALYGNGRYLEDIDHANNDGNASLFDVNAQAAASFAPRPDGQSNPEAFAQLVKLGHINQNNEENCRGCILTVGKFYLQRPAQGSDVPMNLVKVVKIIYVNEKDGPQWGAYVQPWELSTKEDDTRDCLTDPWHAHKNHAANQRYKPGVGMKGQTWSYLYEPLSAFQEQVHMCTSRWAKPKTFTKKLNGTAQDQRGVYRLRMRKSNEGMVRTFMHRWKEDDARSQEESERNKSS